MKTTKNNKKMTFEEFNFQFDAMDKQQYELKSMHDKLDRTSEFLLKYVRKYIEYINNRYDAKMWNTFHIIHGAALYGMLLTAKGRTQLTDKKMELIDRYYEG